MSISTSLIEEQFYEFMRAQGITPKKELSPLIMDGKLHRFAVERDKGGAKSGAYFIHANDCPNWGVMDYHEHHQMQTGKFDFSRLSTEERREHIRESSPLSQVEVEAKKRAEAERQKENDRRAVENASHLYKQAQPDTKHGYWVFKGLDKGPECVRVSTSQDNKEPESLLPFYDVATGEFRGVQHIVWNPHAQKYDKKFHQGTHYRGCACWFEGTGENPNIYVAEGGATAYSAYLMLDRKATVYAALNAGNLKSIAEAIRTKFTGRPITILADNDASNTGQKNAKECLDAGCADRMLLPPNVGSDWNDYYTEFFKKACKPYSDVDTLRELQAAFADFEAKSESETPAVQELTAQTAQTTEDILILDASTIQEQHRYDSVTQRENNASRMNEFSENTENSKKVYSHRSFASLCKKPDPVRYIIEDYLQEEALHLIVGESQSGKSFVALNMALAVACKDIVNWHDTTIPVNKHGPVCYFAGEGARGLGKRCAALAQEYDIDPDNVDLNIIDEVFHLDDTDTEHNITRTIESVRAICGKPELIIFDTLHVFLAGDENKSVDIAQFYTACRQLIREFGCAVILIHHCGISLESKDRGRGSSSLKADADFQLNVERKGDVIAVDVVKNKDDSLRTGLKFNLKQVVLPDIWDKDNGRHSTSCVIELHPLSQHNVPEGEKARAREKEKKRSKFNTQQKRGRETFTEACKQFGRIIKNEESGHLLAILDIENWREIAYELDDAEKEGTKRKHFNDDRNQLTKEDSLLTQRIIEGTEYYCLDLEAEGEEDLRREIRGSLWTREYTKGKQQREAEREAGQATAEGEGRQGVIELTPDSDS